VTRKEGGFRSIYCHNDGSPARPHGVGFTLLTHYAEREKVEQLMALGDLSILGPEIGGTHSWAERTSSPTQLAMYSNWCCADGRDRGDSKSEAQEHADFENLVQSAEDGNAEFLYVLFDEVWLFGPVRSVRTLDDLRPLTAEVVAGGTATDEPPKGWEDKPVYSYPTGLEFSHWLNNGWRQARCLWGDGTRSLVEYRMPGRTSGLRYCEPGQGFRAMAYRSVPKWLLRKLVEVGARWDGTPQQRCGPVPQPAELLGGDAR